MNRIAKLELKADNLTKNRKFSDKEEYYTEEEEHEKEVGWVKTKILRLTLPQRCRLRIHYHIVLIAIKRIREKERITCTTSNL